ncbi:hypothetical protein MNBD_GAMMA23-1020 [hydrothermal vent metagenome]|uniref:Thioredoxin domain-containing protein n=1 Tax=hydrothermal vent metagenome TaxID=652676 RepID=A0A3B1AFR9_9ZZZZ
MKYQKFIFLLILCYLPVTAMAKDSLPEPPKGILKLAPYSAPAIELKDIDGVAFNLSETKKHWVFVHFWASWCGPCRKEMPAIQKMWNILEKEGLKMALINTSEDEDTVFNFIGIYAPNIRALMDRDGQITEKWRPRGLPATYLVDPNGQVRYQALGGRPWETKVYLKFLRRLLKQK